jgi:tetratricopeptide (TPR) repeat protein
VTTLQLRYWRNGELLLRHALDVTTRNTLAEFSLGTLLMKERKTDEALEHLDRAVQFSPDFAEAHACIADLESSRGKFRESIDEYHKALYYRPALPGVLNNLAWLLATNEDPDIRDGGEAVRFAERACELTDHRVTVYIGTLAAAYAEAGRYPDAVRAAERACASARAANETDLLEKNTALLERYRAGQPYHEKREP